ncbi:hypothetical protein BB559_005555 [Furculomyces boomerangus]|uniref:DUF1748-domain-containing protein n=1 Tax=Furculomyces boomerangus TaxID=61424 RepID=A0A2T9Y855_9FUNG|nr:hypothetical protein BB559_005555 [Furculomyces boomerangus]
MLGKLIHFGFDLVLISALLAGIRRTTGLTEDEDPSTRFEDTYIKKYLRLGEKAFDFVVGTMTVFPKYFVRMPPPSGPNN